MEHIQAMLKEMQSILVLCDEPEWAEQMSRLAAKFAAVSAQDAQAVARETLRLYGGMGSLSDLVLYHQGQVSPDYNNRFAALRRDLNKALFDLITAGSTS